MRGIPRRPGLGVIVLVTVPVLFPCGGCGKPALPVVVSYRDSVLGVGKVARFSNRSAKRVTLTVTFENKKTNRRKTGMVDLAPNAVEEVGWLEGWVLEAGETITVAHPDYDTRTWTVP